MRFGIDDLLREKLLARIPPLAQKAEESIKSADKWIAESENNLKSGSFMSCLLTSYLAMFHAARAILFADGFREKSHFAVARYLEEAYQKKGKLDGKWTKLLDHYRELRHDDHYSTAFFTTEKETKAALDDAKRFVAEMKNRLKNKER